MTIRCPNCQAPLEVPENTPSTRGRCPECGANVDVPTAAAPSSACPACGGPMAADAIVCVRCGFDTVTHAYAKTEAGEEEPGGLGLRLVLFLGEWVPGLFRLKVVILALVLVPLGYFVMGLALFFLMLGTVFTACAIGAGGLLLIAQAIAMLIDGEATLLHEALVEFDSSRWLLFLLLLFAPLAGFFVLLKSLMGG